MVWQLSLSIQNLRRCCPFALDAAFNVCLLRFGGTGTLCLSLLQLLSATLVKADGGASTTV